MSSDSGGWSKPSRVSVIPVVSGQRLGATDVDAFREQRFLVRFVFHYLRPNGPQDDACEKAEN